MESAHTQFDTIIIGAGLAGLNCALNLQERGFNALILEAQDAVGGRVRTDNVDGYLLDRGFQVFLTAYPEAARVLDYRGLDLCSFVSGAQIRCNGRFFKLTDPFRDPLSILPMLASDVVPMSDKLKVAYLRQSVKATPVQEIFRREDKKIEEMLEHNYAFSRQIIERFFRPFFGGITLDKTLSGSSRMFEFVYKMMAEGSVTVPRLGMHQIALQLAARKKIVNGDSGIRLNTRVKAIDRANMQVELENGETLKARSIVVATDGPEAHKLLPEIEKPTSRPTTCLYFSAPRPPINEAMLVLNGDGEGPVNNLAVMTNVSKAYAPPDRALISLTVLGETGPMDDAHLLGAVDKQMHAWFGEQVSEWQHLKTYRLHHALPDQTPPWLTPPTRDVRLTSPVLQNGDGQSDRQKIYVAGDHRDNASINGALASGRRAALAICEDLKLAMV